MQELPVKRGIFFQVSNPFLVQKHNVFKSSDTGAPSEEKIVVLCCLQGRYRGFRGDEVFNPPVDIIIKAGDPVAFFLGVKTINGTPQV
ncbi:MAG: hypothetical protein R6U41_11630, partial [Desulfosalsimonas sp.]